MPTETELVSKSLRRRLTDVQYVAFYATVVTLLSLMGVFLSDTFTVLFTGWFVAEPGIHHLHELAFVAMLWTVVIGIAVQLYNPKQRVAAIQQALLANVVITGVNILTGFFFPPALLLGGLLVAAVVLHPAGRDVLRVRTAGPVNLLLAGLTIIAAVPLAAYAAEQYALHASGDSHAHLGHYADMIAYVGLILLLGLLASMQPAGWRVPLWCAGGLAVTFGLSSMLYPTLVSSVGILGGGLATLWGVGFIVAGELSRR